MALGTQMQLRPSTTRAEFKEAHEALSSLATGRCNHCWHALAYAPFVPDAERAVYESNTQSDLNDTALRFRSIANFTRVVNPTQEEYVPVYYTEPMVSLAGKHTCFPDSIPLRSQHHLNVKRMFGCFTGSAQV